jgi:hypothetical protein
MTKRGCIVLLPCFLQACVLGIDYSPQGRHEAFKSVYGAEVGKNSENPKTSLLARYPQLVVARRPLTSNSTEVEFRASRDDIVECSMTLRRKHTSCSVGGLRGARKTARGSAHELSRI